MNAADLIANVSKKVGASFSPVEILAMLNEGLQEVAAGGARPYGLPPVAPLPELLKVETVTVAAGTNTVAMPSTYQRGLITVFDSSGDKVKLYDSFRGFLERYPALDEDGDIESVSLKGRTFYVQGMPSSDAPLTLHFHRYPLPLVEESSSVPEGIPPHLHKKLLYNFACKEAFSVMERGEEGSMPNTAFHTREYGAALTELETFIGPEDGEAQFIDDDGDYIA